MVLAALGMEELYAERYGAITEDGLATFLVLDPENASSVVSCISAARQS